MPRSPTCARCSRRRGVPRRPRGRARPLAGPAPAVDGRGTCGRRPGPVFVPSSTYGAPEFPFPGSGALNRLCVHPAIVDFAERALDSTDLRALPGAHRREVHRRDELRATDAHRSEPLVAPRCRAGLRGGTSRHSSTSPTSTRAPRRPTSSRAATPKAETPACGESCRTKIPSCTRPNDRRPACGVRCSRTATTSSTAASTSPRPCGARVHPRASAFKLASCDWIGYSAPQSRSTSPDWVAFAEGCTPRELELFGFPPPGHPIWTAELLDATAARYPKLDLGPWRASLS